MLALEHFTTYHKSLFDRLLVGVDHRRAHVTVAQQFLHSADVIASFQQMGGERMSEGVTCHAPRNAGVTRSGCHCLLLSALVGVVAV